MSDDGAIKLVPIVQHKHVAGNATKIYRETMAPFIWHQRITNIKWPATQLLIEIDQFGR